MSQYFISDLHLDETRPDITEAFLRLLHSLNGQARQLYILGDFFESWIGDDEDTPLQQQVAKALKALAVSGSELFLMHGNRDFLMGEDFAQRAGATLLPDPSTIATPCGPLLLMHGDSLCSHDARYMKFRATIRNPDFLKPFLARSLEERRLTATQLRAMSQQNNRQKPADIMDVNPAEIAPALRHAQTQWLLHGHTHRPAIHRFEHDGQAAARIVLGDWDEQVWFVRIDAQGRLELAHYPLTQSFEDAKVLDRL